MNADLKMLEEIMRIACAAGQVIMPYYTGEKDIGEQQKEDESPVTLADQEAEKYILGELGALYPNIPVVAEEKVASGDVPDLDDVEYFFLVDPLDGTKEFINKRDEFTVNIALIKKDRPVLGVVYVPALDNLYAGAVGVGAYKVRGKGGALDGAQSLEIEQGKAPRVAVASRSHMSDETKEYLDSKGISEYISAGSSLKFCMVAEGRADIYPRFGRTMEWDTAAGDAVVRAAGGQVVLEDEVTPLAYSKRNQSYDSDFANPFFIVKH